MTIAREIVLSASRTLARYHRYEVHGFERLLDRKSALIVGYHGRPMALDMLMLAARLHDELGYLPHAIVHRAFAASAAAKRFVDDLGFLFHDDDSLADAIARGEHVMVTPGGTREACRSFRERYRVDWGTRMGYVRLAIRHRLPIVPVASDGVDDMYIGFVNGDALGRRLGVPLQVPVWFGVGAIGFWPFSPPLPVKVTQWIGEPILDAANGEVDVDDAAGVEAVHRRVVAAVQALLDRARAMR